jgi:mannose-6-phosphate isomerase-like protein (cupin superfamily)
MPRLAHLITLALMLLSRTDAQERDLRKPSVEERSGSAIIIHRADVVPAVSTNSPPRGGLWPLYSTPEARLNYFAVTGRTGLHFHPDADHRLYVLEGRVLVTAGTNSSITSVGDFIVIPKGVRHSYDVPEKGGRALLLTFDAPPYDPKKTVNVSNVPNVPEGSKEP